MKELNNVRRKRTENPCWRRAGKTLAKRNIPLWQRSPHSARIITSNNRNLPNLAVSILLPPLSTSRSPLTRFSPVHRSHPPSVIPSLSPPAGSLARPLRQPVLRLVRSVSLTSCWVHALPLTAAMVPLLPANGVESCSIVSFSGAIRHRGRGQVPVHLH